jgi:tetraacyldisaccharide 4'-kinase
LNLPNRYWNAMRAPEFWKTDGLAAALLSPLGSLYGWSVTARQARANPFRPKARVLCVGNLTAGGSGKTPVAIAIADILSAAGHRIAFLSRGYGGASPGPLLVDPRHHSAASVGDEPLLLAAHGTTIVARDRAQGAALADSAGADIIIMDDGFQNFQIAKDLSLVVVDAVFGFGNGRVIPAGPLREPVAQGLARADAIVVVGDGAPPLPPFGGPILRAHIVPTQPEALRGHRVVAFAGIGRPQKFFDMLKTLGAQIVAAHPYPDHHPFGTAEISGLRQAAERASALLVTTEKDFARLAPACREGILSVPVHTAFADTMVLHRLLDRIAEPGRVGTR